MRKNRKEERFQARGEEGDEENVETDTSIYNHTPVSEVKRRGSEEAQESKDSTNSNNTNEKTMNIEVGKNKGKKMK